MLKQIKWMKSLDPLLTQIEFSATWQMNPDHRYVVKEL
jgi:hypothetical protein